MSSAILYLAIVAIWAVFLVPAWIRRPHAEVASPEGLLGAHDDVGVEHEAHDEVPAEPHDDAEMPAEEYLDEVPSYAGTGPGPAPRPSQSREQMLRARRRMATILTSMTLITVAFALMGFVQWWICVPPAGMLTLYVLLLREIAMADAELARKRDAWLARQAHEAQRQERAEWAEAQAREAEAGGPGAQIIDISGRVGDQLYDQYADAAVRAVGD